MSLSSVENAAPHLLFPTLNAVHGLRSAAVIGTRYGASLQICASADDTLDQQGAPDEHRRRMVLQRLRLRGRSPRRDQGDAARLCARERRDDPAAVPALRQIEPLLLLPAVGDIAFQHRT